MDLQLAKHDLHLFAMNLQLLCNLHERMILLKTGRFAISETQFAII